MRTGKQGTFRVRFDNDGCPSVPKLTRAILQLILSKFMMKMGVETPRGLSRKIHARIWRPLSGTRSVCYLSHPSLMEGPPTLFSFAKSSLLCSNHGQGTFPSVTSRQPPFEKTISTCSPTKDRENRDSFLLTCTCPVVPSSRKPCWNTSCQSLP